MSYRPVFSEPKTRKSRRSIALDKKTLEVLKTHKRAQGAERLAWGPAWQDNGLIFCREDGTPLHPERVTSWFEQAVRKVGLPRQRLHDLRHAYATAALISGVPNQVVSERLGHSSPVVTSTIYQHVTPAMDQDAATCIAVRVDGESA